MLQIDEIIKQIKAVAATDPIVGVRDEVAKGETSIGHLTPELAAIYVLLDEAVKSKHKTEAQIHNMIALDKPQEDIDALALVVRALEDKRELLHTLMFHEIRAHFNNYTDPGMGIRKGNIVVAFSDNPERSSHVEIAGLGGMPDAIKDLLRMALGKKKRDEREETND